MAITVEHYLNQKPKRLTPLRWLLASLLLSAAACAAVLAYQAKPDGASEAGIGKRLNLTRVEHLPEWAREVVHDQQLGADYQFVATIIDLDRDRQYEILLAPAPPSPDLFVADHPLAIIRYHNETWRYQATPVSCRPTRLGSFLSNGVWDLPCRTANGSTVLRWSGSGYVEAGQSASINGFGRP